MTENDTPKATPSPSKPPTGPNASSVMRPPRFKDLATKEAHEGMVIDRRYRLVRRLGEGGMGVVWQATQEVIDRPVAIKLLHSSLISSPEVQARFEVEARAIGRLRHTNCVTLFDFGRSETLDSCFMVLEYVEGQALADLMSGRDFTIDEIIQIGAQTADALDHAHLQGIIHRDIKPENIMLSGTANAFQVKVLDFGIARIVDNSAEGDNNGDGRQGRITRAGQVFGTPVYMAPEQATGKYTFGPQCDIYSLGIILYELIERHPPFDDEQPVAILLKHVTDPLPPIQREDVPDELKQLIYDMLEKLPANRVATAREVKDRLLEIEQALHPERHLRGTNSFIGVAPTLPPFEEVNLPTDAVFPNPPRMTPPPSSSFIEEKLRALKLLLNYKENSKLIVAAAVAFFALLGLVLIIASISSGGSSQDKGGNSQEKKVAAEVTDKKPNDASDQNTDDQATNQPTGQPTADKAPTAAPHPKVGPPMPMPFVGPPLPEPKPEKKEPPKPAPQPKPRHRPAPKRRYVRPAAPAKTKIPVFKLD